MSVYAQEYGYFFNSTNSDRTYSADSFETWLKPFFQSGVFAGSLQVTAQPEANMTVNVSGGYANLNGKAAYWPTSNVLEISTASGVYDRIDTIVLRRNNTNRTVSIEVVTGVASANPSPTEPTRTSDIFELVLAQILVRRGTTEITDSVITDTRTNTNICGYVSATVEEVDFNQFKTQFDAWAVEYQGETQADFTDWFDAIKGQLDEDAAGHLQLEVNDLDDRLTVLESKAILIEGSLTAYNLIDTETITNANITETMIPFVQFEDETVFTSNVTISVVNGSVSVSARLAGTTSFRLLLIEGN